MTESSIQVEASPVFNRNLRTLAKKYRNIRDDIQPVIEQLERGEHPGDRISGVKYEVFKLRVRNSDVQKGKNCLMKLPKDLSGKALIKSLLRNFQVEETIA